MDIHKYFDAVIKQDAKGMAEYFCPNAQVRWHNTNEQFTQKEFIYVNCKYPGNWDGEIEILTPIQGGYVMAARVWEKEEKTSFHVVSFLKITGDKISSIDEYWGDDGEIPEWRQKA